jgi:hypothetical protein
MEEEMKNDWLGYLLLIAAVVGIFGGIHLVADHQTLGWLGIAGGVALAIASRRVRKGEEPSEA